MAAFEFHPATKEASKARIALTGPSGSGKTYTALLVADALGPRRALIDTERGSASKYKGLVDFDTLQMHAFDPRDLGKAIAAATAAAYDVLIVDSLSHFWMGVGGILEQVDAAAKRSYGGNTFGGWKEARPVERAMIDALIAYPGHVIVTLRTKTEWVIEENERGKKQPRKVGTKPEQREGIEYEFDVVGDLDHENTLVVSKTRCPALAKAVIPLPDGDNFAKPILDWLNDDATPVLSVADYLARALDPSASAEDLLAIYTDVSARNLLGAAVLDETGDALTLGELIRRKGAAARRQEQATAQDSGGTW